MGGAESGSVSILNLCVDDNSLKKHGLHVKRREQIEGWGCCRSSPTRWIRDNNRLMCYTKFMAKDAIHDSIKNALIKDGWAITAEFLQIEYEELEIFADLVAEREPIVAEKQGKKIIVEVKTFAGCSFIRELQQALGQYDLYVDIIALAGLDYDLYLAVSSVIYETFFLRKGTHEIVQRRRLQLLVVDIERAEVMQWIE